MAHENHATAITQCALLIYSGFIKYNEAFARITNRARRRFEQLDWKGHQQDIVDRVDLYTKSILNIVRELRKALGPRVNDNKLWNEIRRYYGERLKNVPDAGFMKTYFNSITRHIFGTVGINPQLEFISPAPDEGFAALESLSLKRYPYWGSISTVFMSVLNDFSFKVPYGSLKKDIEYIVTEINQFADVFLDRYGEFLRFEFIDSVFYQSARAYLVGRVVQQDHISPIVIALKNTGEGIHVDALLMSEDEVSIVFSYTRSYYFADPGSVVGAVHFLHSILPYKPIDELYTVLGRLRQGKAERYRVFSNHLNETGDKFEHAAGEKGLVMIVFTLPSYDLVFKIIRDKFGLPKTITRDDVIEKI